MCTVSCATSATSRSFRTDAVSTPSDLHVWSLSESKIVASVHIMVKGPDLVNVSREIKRRFHRFGIHSS